MAGYSGTPLARKLGIKPGHRVLLRHAPDDFEATLGDLPEGAIVLRRARSACDVIVAFYDRGAKLEREFAKLAALLEPAGGLWLAWPKRSAGVATDLDGGVIRGVGLSFGLVDNKVCAIDETWSGHRFVIRLKDR